MKRSHRRSRESELFVDEVRRWAAKMGVDPDRVYVQRMSKKWASCSPEKRIYFAFDLVEESPRFRDFVIVHELLHLRIQNHGKLFKSLLNSFVPGWEKEIRGKANRTCR